VRGLWALTWLELKIFIREPLGFFGSVFMPVAVFVILGRAFAGRGAMESLDPDTARFAAVDGPVFAAIFVLLSAVLSLVTIIAIYREGGILKRLRATPLRPHTILGAQVIVKLLLSAVTLILVAIAGRRYYVGIETTRVLAFSLALVISGASILSIGFLIASLVPTARFAQPVGAVVLYPMLGLSGLFFPLAALPPGLQLVSNLLPLTYSVSLLRGIWLGDPWVMHLGDVAALAIATAICGVLTARVFRWE
jgi:ABC-2 type transport system permease protein